MNNDDAPPTSHQDIGDEIESVMAEINDLNAGVTQAIVAAESTQVGGSLVPVGGDALTLKTMMAEKLTVIESFRQQLESKTAHMQRLIERQRKEIERRAREMSAVLAPLKEQAALMEEGIWTMGLYLGGDESFTPIADGEPAPAATPIHVFQTTLYMDEETGLRLDDGGFDAQDLERFDEWLLADPAHLEQILPHRRGVVALQPRRKQKDYDDPWKSFAMSELNVKTYWLVRNGERLYRMTTNFQVGKTLTPTRNEFTSFFVNTWHRDRPLEPGSEDWLQAEKSADARKRHFMRVALVLQGLIDRTTAFHPLPAEHVSLLTPESYDAGHVVIISDADAALETGRVPFSQWLRSRNDRLMVGMRVLVGSGYGTFRPEDIYPDHAPMPEAGIHQIEDQEADGRFVVRYKRTDKRWGYEDSSDPYSEYGQWPYKTRASVRFKSDNKSILPFDAVTVEELQTYIGARSERANDQYLTMLPLLKTALEHKQAETEAEAPIIEMLTGMVASTITSDVPTVAEHIGEAVQIWKLRRRRHRALTTEDTTGTTVVGMVEDMASIVTSLIAAEATAEQDRAILAQIRAAHPDAVFIGRKTNGQWITYVPENDSTPYLREITTSAAGKSSTEKRWVGPQRFWMNWRVMHQNEAAWSDLVTKDIETYLTDDERERLIDEVAATWRYSDMVAQSRRFTDVEKEPELPETKAAEVFWVPNTSQYRTGYHGKFAVACINPRVPTAAFHSHDDLEPSLIFEAYWTRSNDGQVRVAKGTWDSSSSFSFGHSGKSAVSVFSDPAEQAKIESRKKLIETVKQQRDAKRDLGDAVVASVAEQFDKLFESAAYASFLERYLDPDLWEGHRKTIKIPTFANHDDSHTLHRMVDRLIQRNSDFDGMTVLDALGLAYSAEDLDDRVFRGFNSVKADRDAIADSNLLGFVLHMPTTEDTAKP